MKKKFLGLKYIKKEEGFVLITILMIFVIVSILGIGLLSVSTSNFRQTGSERDFQAVYYIAEAGINQAIYDIGIKVEDLSDETLSHVQFFEELNDFIKIYMDDDDVKILDDFEKSFGEKPVAAINIEVDNADLVIVDESTQTKGTTNYIIRSVGKIGSLSRTVSTSIGVAHGISKETESSHHPAFDYALYSGGNSVMAIPSGSTIDGPVYAHNVKFNASGTKINGSIISEKSVELSSDMEIEGNIYAMDGTVEILSNQTKVFGDIHAMDNVLLSSGTTLEGDIYTNGSITLNSSDARVNGDIHTAGNITLGSSAKVGNMYTNGNITLSSDNIVNGEMHSIGNITFNGSAKAGNIFTKGDISFNRGIIIDGDINASGYVGDSSSGGNVEVNGDIYSDSNVTTLNNQTFKFHGHVNAAGNVENGNGNNIFGDVISGKHVINRGRIHGTIIENGEPIRPQDPIYPKALQFEAYETIENPKLNKELLGHQPSTVKSIISTNTLKLSPGNYGIIEFDTNQGGIIMLESGGSDYFFNSITGGNQQKTMRLDFSKGGNINIYIKNNLKWNGKIQISMDGINWLELKNLSEEEQKKLAERVYWETHGSFEMNEGGDKHWLGTILSKGDIYVASNPYIVGAFVTHSKINFNNSGGTITYASENISNGGSGGSGNVNEKGKNSIASEYRITTSSPIREK